MAKKRAKPNRLSFADKKRVEEILQGYATTKRVFTNMSTATDAVATELGKPVSVSTVTPIWNSLKSPHVLTTSGRMGKKPATAASGGLMAKLDAIDAAVADLRAGLILLLKLAQS